MSILALDVGGTHLRSAWVDGLDVSAERRTRPDLTRICSTAGPSAKRELLHVLLTHIEQRLAGRRSRTVALAFPGFVTADGVLLASPNLPGIRNLDLRDAFHERGLEAAVANDGLCAARGAWLLENPRPASLALATLGTGLGGGLILDGRPVFGDGGTAMEIGHLPAVDDGHPCGCGKRGCLEQYVSAQALSRLDDRGREPEQIAAAARDGDQHAAAIFAGAGFHLGRGLAQLVLLVDVRIIRVGGGLSRSWDLMEDPFHRSLDDHLIPPLRGRIDVAPVPPQMVDRIGLIGAADLAL